MKELTAEVADLERRLTRQLINLEADDLTPSLRRRINGRVSELEDAIVERNQRLSALAEQAAMETPSLDDVAPLLDRLPVLVETLADVPQAELRALFDGLQLEVAYHPAESALDVSITLYGEDSLAFSGEKVRGLFRAPGGAWIRPEQVCAARGMLPAIAFKAAAPCTGAEVGRSLTDATSRPVPPYPPATWGPFTRSGTSSLRRRTGRVPRGAGAMGAAHSGRAAFHHYSISRSSRVMETPLEPGSSRPVAL